MICAETRYAAVGVGTIATRTFATPIFVTFAPPFFRTIATRTFATPKNLIGRERRGRAGGGHGCCGGCWKSLKVHLVTTHWRKAFCMLTMCWGTFWWKQLEDTHESLGKALPKFWSSTGFSTAERSPKGNSTREKHVCSMFRNKFYCEQHENAIEKLCWLTLAEKNYVPNMLYF